MIINSTIPSNFLSTLRSSETPIWQNKLCFEVWKLPELFESAVNCNKLAEILFQNRNNVDFSSGETFLSHDCGANATRLISINNKPKPTLDSIVSKQAGLKGVAVLSQPIIENVLLSRNLEENTYNFVFQN